MKKALLTLAVLALAGSAYAQGTISFTNFEIPNANGVGSYNAQINKANGQPAGAGYSAGLFLGETLIGSAVDFFGETGFFIGPDLTVPGQAAGTAPSVTLRAWKTSEGTYATATEKGTTAAFTTQPLGGVNPAPPPPAFFTPGMTGVAQTGGIAFQMTVPEPSTYALGIAGLGALAMMRRRK